MRVAEDAVARFQETGARLKALSITAKSRICFKNEPLCSPAYCEYARDYHAKVHAHGILDILAKKRRLKARVFRDLGETYQVCPFELQLGAAFEADIVICDYNYVFAPRSALRRVSGLGIDQAGKPSLVIDEAHNLPSRAMDYYSPALCCATLERMREETRELPARFRREAVIDLPELGRRFRIAPGEMILTEISRKFQVDEMAATTARFGFALERAFPDPAPSFPLLLPRLRGRRTSLKAVLLDQASIAGVGNIYADESLHRARLRLRECLEDHWFLKDERR